MEKNTEVTPVIQPVIQPPPPSSLPVVILSVLVVLCLVGMGFMYWQNQQLMQQLGKTTNKSQPVSVEKDLTVNPTVTDVTADWKTYTNTAYKYSVKYPADWSITAKGDSEISTFPAPYLNSPCVFDSGDLCSQIYIQTSPADPSHMYDPSFIISLTGSNPDKVSHKIEMTVGNEPAQGFEYFQANYGESGRLVYVVVTNHHNTKYTITYEESQKNIKFSSSSDWKRKMLFDQILSTFKFTDTTQAGNSEALLAAKKYLDAYVAGNWKVAKQYGDTQLDERIAGSYGYTKYEITGSKADIEPSLYHVYVRFTDKNGKVWDKVPHSTILPLEVLMTKSDGSWKALTWYFYE